MPTKKNTKGKKASILRQLTGAVVGGSLAIGIYYTYEYGAPVVTAWLTVPQDQFTIGTGASAQKDLKESEQRRISQRAQYIVDKFGQEIEPPPPMKDVPANWDLDAIENMEQSADEGWGGWTDEWPEPPEEPQEEEADEWDAVWDDTWDDDFEALSELAYENDPVAAESWDDTWDDTYWEEDSLASDTVARTSLVAETVSTSPPPVVREEPMAVTSVSSGPVLPSSGVELWLAALVTLGGTAMLRRRSIIDFVRGKRV